MRAELRYLHTIDPIEIADFRDVRPAEDAFCIWLQAIIGLVGEEGEESFSFAVCSPAWFSKQLEREPVLSGRFFHVVKYDPKPVEEYLNQRIAEAIGDDWNTIGEKLSRWSQWEFEDYRPARP